MANDFVLIVEKVAYYSGKPKEEREIFIQNILA